MLRTLLVLAFLVIAALPARAGWLVPLDKANMEPQELLSWASIAATSSMTFDPANPAGNFMTARGSFTDKGWAELLEATSKLGVLIAVYTDKQAVVATLAGEPEVQSAGAQGGLYRWTVIMPLLLTYSSGSTKTLNVTLSIQRSTAPENVDGIAISEWRQAEAQ